MSLPNYVESIKDKLAENIHEMWAMNKIEAGWQWGDHRDDLRHLHPCLVPFDKLPPAEKRYDSQLAVQTLKSVQNQLLVTTSLKQTFILGQS